MRSCQRVMSGCNCKGIRTCLVCEKAGAVPAVWPKVQHTLYQCHNCGKLSPDIVPSREDPPLYACSSSCVTVPVLAGEDSCNSFGGTLVVKDFLTQKGEEEVVTAIDTSQWVGSQEGRKKQARSHACDHRPRNDPLPLRGCDCRIMALR